LLTFVIVPITPFATNLRSIRTECMLSLADVGKLMGTSRQVVWSWETGRTEPTFEQLTRLATVLGVTTDDLLKPPPTG
jgi:transcriptional regulator with XRE-family HTH domain